MKRLAISILFFLFTLALLTVGLQAAGPASAFQSLNDKKPLTPLAEQLITLERALPDAEKRHDRDFYKRTLADDFISIGTDGKIQRRQDILGDLPSTQLNEYRLYNIQVVPLNDGAAVVTYDVIVVLVHYDDDTPRYQHVSSIWVKQGDQWKLKFQQATASR